MTSRELTVPRIPQRTPPSPPLLHDLRHPAVIGIIIVIAFFVIGGGWAWQAPLSGSVIAPGVMSPEGQRQTVQHLEGGIIREILVKDGDKVTKDQPLVVLEDVRAQAAVGAQRSRLRALAAAEARLRAERAHEAEIAFDHPSLADRSNQEVEEVIAQQVNQFKTRHANDESREAILSQRVLQLKQQITGAERQLEGVRRQNELIREEIDTVADLVRQGYERKPRLLALQRTEAELMGTEGELVSRMARAEEAIGETRLQIINLKTDRVEQADAELSQVQAQRIEVEQSISESRDRLSRTVIVAPADGTVLDLRFGTPGGVIRPGEPVLDIVPATDALIIDARVSPRDIDDVVVGQDAHVTFPSYSQRYMLRVPATVTQVSADSLEDERSGQRYYTAKVKVDKTVLKERAPMVELQPGLPAEVFITTMQRTVLEYLIPAVQQFFHHSLREN